MSETPQTPPPPPEPSSSAPSGSHSGGTGPSINTDQVKAAFAGANQYDLGIMAAGLLALIFSLFSFYTASAGGFSVHINAWHGFFGWFAVLLAFAASVVLALGRFGIRVLDAARTRLAVLAAYGVAVLCMILALFIIPKGGCGGSLCNGINFGHGFGYWITFIVIIAGAVLAFLRKDATD